MQPLFTEFDNLKRNGKIIYSSWFILILYRDNLEKLKTASLYTTFSFLISSNRVLVKDRYSISVLVRLHK